MTWTLSGSVGRWERGALNRKADVETIQTLLTAAARTRQNPAFDPGGIDGAIARPPRRSGTVVAIEAFQAPFLSRPDGLVSVGGRTFRALVEAAGPPPPPPEPGSRFFPFRALPAAPWTWISPPRRFGANRGGGRAHAGCDLYFPLGTLIHAVGDGVVVRGPYYFYNQTYALDVDHGDVLVRYGEVQKATIAREGDRVEAGQPIAKVGHLVGISVPSDMLHLEVYGKTAQGPLTVAKALSKRHTNGRPFYRRRDLLDPTPFLDQWKERLAP